MSALLVRTNGTVELLPDHGDSDSAILLHDEGGGEAFVELEISDEQGDVVAKVFTPLNGGALEENETAGKILLQLSSAHVVMRGPALFNNMDPRDATEVLGSL